MRGLSDPPALCRGRRLLSLPRHFILASGGVVSVPSGGATLADLTVMERVSKLGAPDSPQVASAAKASNWVQS